MPILELRGGQSATRFILLTCGCGAVFGLLFGLPPAFAVYAAGAPFPWSAAALVIGLLAGYLLAFLLLSFVYRPNVTMVTVSRSDRPAPRVVQSPRNAKSPATVTKLRMAEEKARLDRMEAERKARHDRSFEKVTEQRIIWSELLELELEALDERVDRMRKEIVATGWKGDSDGHGRK
jgi:hypothetical protein